MYRRQRPRQHLYPQSARNKRHVQVARSPTTSTARAPTDGTSNLTRSASTCYRAKRRRGRRQGPPATPSSTVQAVESGPVSQIAVQHYEDAAPTCPRRRRKKHAAVTGKDGKTASPVTPDHHIFTKGAWRRARLRDHPKVAVSISMDTTPRQHGPIPNPTVTADVSAVADSGAQSDLWSLTDYLAHGFPRDALAPVTLGLSAANRSPISIEGGFFARIVTRNRQDKVATCRSMIYVSTSVQGMYLSLETMLNLSILARDFPTIGEADKLSDRHQEPESDNGTTPPSCGPTSVNAVRAVNGGCNAPSDPDTASCSCPQRSVTPTRPTRPPVRVYT